MLKGDLHFLCSCTGYLKLPTDAICMIKKELECSSADQTNKDSRGQGPVGQQAQHHRF